MQAVCRSHSCLWSKSWANSERCKKCCRAAFSTATAEAQWQVSEAWKIEFSHQPGVHNVLFRLFQSKLRRLCGNPEVHFISSPRPTSGSPWFTYKCSFDHFQFSLQGWWYTTSVYSDAGGEQKSQSVGPGCMWGHWFGVLEISILRSWWWNETTWPHQHWVKYRDINHPLGGKSSVRITWHEYMTFFPKKWSLVNHHNFTRQAGSYTNLSLVTHVPPRSHYQKAPF